MAYLSCIYTSKYAPEDQFGLHNRSLSFEQVGGHECHAMGIALK